MEYFCKCCDYKTTYHTNYKKHMGSKKHKELSQIFVCKYCEKEFTFKQSMYRHIKYSCKKNKDEDLNELVRLMNLQLEKKDEQIETLTKQIEKLNKILPT